MALPHGLGSHPYLPTEAVIAGYAANETPLPKILIKFSLRIVAVLLSSIALSRQFNPRLRLADLLAVSWFSLNGYLHLFFESYFVLNAATLAGSQSLLAQLWKEYALSDSRYLTSDTFVWTIEAISVVCWGPLSVATAFCIVRGSNMRYPLQLLLSMAHIYGVALYYGTSTVDLASKGIAHSRPEFLYFWVYYVGMNLPWAVVPAGFIFSSVRKICKALGVAERAELAAIPNNSNGSKKIQ
ncbi:hypothetical protein RB598_008243 [Gaeumannomyces tritici]